MRTYRLTLTLLVLTLALTAGAMTPSGAAARASRDGTATAAPGRSVGRPFDYTKVRGLSQPRFETMRESAEVTMKDDINIYMEIERPKSKGRFGTILYLSPYHGTLQARDGARILPGPKAANGSALGLSGYFAPRGYAVVFADLRGTGRSQGCLDHMGPKDQSDSVEIIKWIAKQPWSNGKVGMTGHSYVGSTPSMAMAEKPKALKTIVPSAGLAAMYHHEFQDGVPYYLQWAGPLFAYEQLAIERYLPGGDNGPTNSPQYFGCGATQSAAVTGEAYFSGAETEWHRERDWRKPATKADIPVFMVHGVDDNAARIAAIDWFNKRQNRKDKTWIGQWDHGSGCCPNTRTCNQTSTAPCENDQWTYALHAWFDKWLSGRKVDTGPPTEIFLNNGKVFTSRVWPPTPEKNLKLYARTDGGLATQPDDSGEVSYIADQRGFEDEFDTGNAIWTSAKMKKDTMIVGVPKLKLVTSVTSPRIHINATLYDQDEDGDLDRIGRAGWAIQPELRDGWADPQVVVPGEAYTIDLESMAQAHVVQKGHKLVFIVASSHPDKVPTFGAGAQVTIHTGGGDGTCMTLPVITNPKLFADPLGPLGRI